MEKRKLLIILLSIGLYLVASGVSYTIFSKTPVSSSSSNPYLSPVENKKTANDYEALEFDANASKTEECPLNGVMYSKEQKSWWEKHRPLGVMIENSTDARPQSGISFADVTYEAVAEGGITRTLNVYYCQDAGIVGPVRSARTYFLDYISEYGNNPLYAHVGGANTPGPANALGQIEDYGWSQYNDLNQFSIGFPTFKRDESRLGRDVATEHTMYSTTTKLWSIGEKRGLTNKDKKGDSWEDSFVPYTFKDDAALSARGESQIVHLPFWDNAAYTVDWTYNKTDNLYYRKNGNVSHVDRNTNKQLTTKNVIVLFMKESRANDEYEGNLHMLYADKGTGKALVYMNGKEIKATWKKATRTSRTKLYASDGTEIAFTRGKLWFEIADTSAEVTAK